MIYVWAVCPCEDERDEAMQATAASALAAASERATAAALNYDGLAHVQHLQLRSFNPARLRPVRGVHPYDVAVDWLEKVIQLDRAAEGAGSSLWFYSPQPGRGKTHLAAGLAWDVKSEGRGVVFLSARTWMPRYWAASFEERPRLLSYAAERAHLLVVDDLGYGATTDAAVNLWDTLIDLRCTARRWTVFTSQETPEELKDRGYLTDAAYSRIRGMTRGVAIEFDGEDGRQWE